MSKLVESNSKLLFYTHGFSHHCILLFYVRPELVSEVHERRIGKPELLKVMLILQLL